MGVCFYLTREGLKEEERARQGGGREGGSFWEVRCWMLNALSLTKIDNVSFFLVMLAGYESIVNIVCMHSCTLYIHMHSHAHIHTLLACCSCKWYFLRCLTCAFSSAVFCWRKTSSCWRFSTSLRQGGKSTLALVRQTIIQALCIYTDAAKQLIILTKHWKLLEFRVVVSTSSSCPHLSYSRQKLTVSALR